MGTQCSHSSSAVLAQCWPAADMYMNTHSESSLAHSWRYGDFGRFVLRGKAQPVGVLTKQLSRG